MLIKNSLRLATLSFFIISGNTHAMDKAAAAVTTMTPALTAAYLANHIGNGGSLGNQDVALAASGIAITALAASQLSNQHAGPVYHGAAIAAVAFAALSFFGTLISG